MDGKNSYGRRISLLNEGESEWSASNPAGRTSHSLPFHSRASSFASRSTSSRNLSHSSTSNTSSKSISGSPTPQLVRSGSSDSTEMQRTPSPLTPDLGFAIEGLAVGQKYADPSTAFASSSPYNNAPTQHIQQYASISEQPQPLPVAPYQRQPSIGQKRSLYTAPQPTIDDTSSEPSTTSLRGSSRSSGPSRKNHYPCPLARQYSCQDYFTTSGHAARHAKKHTGRKDALCPECNKAFTRKDNMEQHRRTHQTGRKASKDSAEFSSSSKRAKSISKSAKPLAIQASPQAESATPLSPARSYSSYADSTIGLAPQPYPNIAGQNGYAYPNSTAYYDTTPLTGLDTLAIAASADDSRSP